jgi:hypothetical protein
MRLSAKHRPSQIDSSGTNGAEEEDCGILLSFDSFVLFGTIVFWLSTFDGIGKIIPFDFMAFLLDFFDFEEMEFGGGNVAGGKFIAEIHKICNNSSEFESHSSSISFFRIA